MLSDLWNKILHSRRATVTVDTGPLGENARILLTGFHPKINTDDFLGRVMWCVDPDLQLKWNVVHGKICSLQEFKKDFERCVRRDPLWRPLDLRVNHTHCLARPVPSDLLGNPHAPPVELIMAAFDNPVPRLHVDKWETQLKWMHCLKHPSATLENQLDSLILGPLNDAAETMEYTGDYWWDSEDRKQLRRDYKAATQHMRSLLECAAKPLHGAVTVSDCFKGGSLHVKAATVTDATQEQRQTFRSELQKCARSAGRLVYVDVFNDARWYLDHKEDGYYAEPRILFRN